MFNPFSRAALVAGLIGLAAPVLAQSDPGSYLAARQAAAANDFAQAARFYTRSLVSDPGNPALLENALIAYVMLGQMDQAIPVATAMEKAGVQSQLAHLVLAAQAGVTGDWDAIAAAQDQGKVVSPLVDGLFKAWAALGRGDMQETLALFDAVINAEGMAAYGTYHKALALASVGDFEGADAIFTDAAKDGRVFSVRAAVAHAQVLSQLGRDQDASRMLLDVFGNAVDPSIRAMLDQLAANETIPFTVVQSPRQGMAEVVFMIAGLLQSDARATYTLQYARIAQYLDPTSTDAILLTASLLLEMNRYQLASDTFALVPTDDLAFPTSEMGRIDALRMDGQSDTAIEVARALARSHPELPFVQAKLGDMLRADERYGPAMDAYTTALDLYAPQDPMRWRILYSRATSAHANGNWPQAEVDFRAALALRPEQPQVLNYLGYSLVERGEKLDEALQMIETAVAAQPENGAFVDSLGWVLFELGRYDEAVVHMENAAALEATDPIVNDHLGDVYWAVGRRIEARFQWNRALSFKPDDMLAKRIRQKLEIGLDAVLAAEGADPIIRMANDEG